VVMEAGTAMPAIVDEVLRMYDKQS
jgi:hypothetical protein